jgi:hypothetical protein
VQQPINADGSSVWSAKKGVIPVQFTLQQATDTTTTTTTTDAVYPDTLESDNGASCPAPNYTGPGCYGNLSFTPPAGTTVGSISNLTAHFGWPVGHNAGGSMRWALRTPDGEVWIYYGDLATTFQSGTGGSGTNMLTLTDARVEASQLGHSPQYDTLANVLAAPAPTASYGTIANEPVTGIDLVVDAGWALTQRVQLSDVQITANGSTSEYVPGTVPGSTSTSDSVGPWTATTSPAMYIDVVKGNPSDPGTVDETTYTGVGDSGGQFAVVDGKYKYNLSNASAPLGSAGTYYVYMNSGPTLGNINRVPTINAPGNIASFVLK